MNPDLEPFVSQKSDEWATPPDLLRALGAAVGGFDLDPCSGAETRTIAAEAYDAEDDGLAREWFGHVWLNPPYSAVGEWLRKAVDELRRERVASILALVKGDTSTNWWQRYAVHAEAVALLNGRLSFGAGENSAPFPSHVIVYGAAPPAVYETLQYRGIVLPMEPVETSEQRGLADYYGGGE